MHQLLVPLGLFLWGAFERNKKQNAAPAAAPPAPAIPRAPAAQTRVVIGPAVIDRARAAKAQRRPTRRADNVKVGPVTIEHPDVIPAPPHDQAAVDAAMTQVIKDTVAPKAVAPQPAAAAPQRSPKDAAVALQRFLIRTGRFGTLKDRPQEVKDAQRDLGVQPDGIVGKRTRLAAKNAGVALPPIK